MTDVSDLPAIKAVKPLPKPYGLRVTFKDGGTADVDLTGVVHRVKAFAPLRDPKRFRRVAVIPYGPGVGITWGDDLDYSAESLRTLADIQAPFAAETFRAWQQALGLSNRQAADVLGLSVETVNKYRAGATIPDVVALACRAVEHNPALASARFRPRRPGRPRKTASAPKKPKDAASAA